jgi:hypothetical protein
VATNWQSDDGKSFREGPEGVSAEEAIAWGRAQGDVVQIRVGEDHFYYSAGARQPENEQLPVWPQDGVPVARRRAPSMAYLDRTADDPPITWEVRISADDLPLTPEQRVRFAERFGDAVATRAPLIQRSRMGGWTMRARHPWRASLSRHEPGTRPTRSRTQFRRAPSSDHDPSSAGWAKDSSGLRRKSCQHQIQGLTPADSTGAVERAIRIRPAAR